METHTIFFVGKPGCGKGTQAKLLTENTGWKAVSSGEVLRAIAAEDTLLGRKIRSEVDVGVLVPYWFVTYLYLKVLSSLKDGESIIFDGFNRRLSEAEIIIDSLKWLNRSFTILDIKVSDEEVQKRLAKRKGIEGRVDDTAVEERLKEYHEYTERALEKFRELGVLIEINGEQTPEKTAADVRVALGISHSTV